VAACIALYAIYHYAVGVRVLGAGGKLGSEFRPHPDGDTFDYGERVRFSFDSPVLPKSFHYHIDPQTPSSAHIRRPGFLELEFRKVPGIRYTITIDSDTRSIDGANLHTPYVYHVTTMPDVVIPAPARVLPREPYRYGVLMHPWMHWSDPAESAQMIDLLARARMDFVRFDFVGTAIEPSRGVYDFTVYDSVIERLRARNITMLPVVLQYNAPTWATHGRPYPALWDSPREFARYAAAIAAHLHLKYPTISRIELFNEPNTRAPNWWSASDDTSVTSDGTGTAAYMKAAYAAIKAVYPKVRVVGPSLASGGDHTDSRQFLTTLYREGCHAGTCWDILSVHNYDWEDPTVNVDASIDPRFDVYKDLQAIARENGDPTPHVMITEWGYSTANVDVGFDPRVQARYIALGLNRALADPTIDGIAYVSLQSSSDAFWDDTGLVAKSGEPKPGFYAFSAFAPK